MELHNHAAFGGTVKFPFLTATLHLVTADWSGAIQCHVGRKEDATGNLQDAVGAMKSSV